MLRPTIIPIGFGSAILFALPMTSVLAHTTEVVGDVAGTWHVEPNHTPKAGKPATVWIALTRKGGKILPLQETNCQLRVYDLPRRQGDVPVLRPPLQAIVIKQDQGIPGAAVVFPRTGLYQLELGCTPKVEESFSPFQMTYQVTVTAGSASAALPDASPQPETVTSPSIVATSPEPTPKANQFNPTLLVWLLGAIAATVTLGLGLLKLTARK